MKKPSFLLKFLLALAILVMVSQTIMLVIFTQRIHQDLQAETVNNLRSTALLLREWAREDLSALFHGEPRDILGKISNRGGYEISLMNSEGKLLQDTHLSPGIFQDTVPGVEIDLARQDREGWVLRRSSVLDKEMLYFALSFYDEGKLTGFLRVGTPADKLGLVMGNLYFFFFTVSFISLLIVFIFAFAYSRNFSRNISIMIQNAGKFAQGLEYEKPYVEKPEELKLLAMAMNKMFDQLQDRIDTIQTQKRQLQAILAGMVEAVVVLDLQSHILTWNPAAKKLFPSEKPVEGKSFIEVVRSSHLDELATKLLTGQCPQIMADILLSDLATTIQVQGASLVRDKGELWGAVLVISDVTQLKKLEAVRRDFVANVSHELKTPITNILGFVETLQEGAINDPVKAKDFLKIVARHSQRLNLIVDDLLILSKLENDPNKGGDKQNVVLQELLSTAAGSLRKKAQKKNILIDFNVPKKDVICAVHPLLMEQALVNLLDNAVKFSPEKTTIILGLKAKEDHIHITVDDQGSGIPEKEQTRIFERFYRTEKGREKEGTGLGLSIVKHILIVHRGNVSVISPVPDKTIGTRFILDFPLEIEKEIDEDF